MQGVGVKVNVEKSGVMHISISQYKYLGCMVNDQLNCARMVE